MRAVMVGAALAACAATASAEEARFFRCDPPQGKRVDYGDLEALDGNLLRRFDDGPQWSDDAHSGVRPVVVLDRGTMLVSRANAVPENLRGLVHDGRHVTRVPITGRDSISVWGNTTTASTAAVWRYYLNYNVLYLLESSIALPRGKRPDHWLLCSGGAVVVEVKDLVSDNAEEKKFDRQLETNGHAFHWSDPGDRLRNRLKQANKKYARWSKCAGSLA